MMRVLRGLTATLVTAAIGLCGAMLAWTLVDGRPQDRPWAPLDPGMPAGPRTAG